MPIADIGTADGDLGLFFSSIGYDVDLIDYPWTNWNAMKGVRHLRDALNATANIYEINLDKQFILPRDQYGLVFLLGTLYHLKNPYYVLEHLAERPRTK